MPTPHATLTSTTATGDVITSPGCPKLLIKGMPCSCVGDLVSGAACVGSVTASTVTKYMCCGKPFVNIGSTVTGSNPATGAPVSTTVAVSSCTNKLI